MFGHQTQTLNFRRSYASQILTNIGREPSETSKVVTGSSVVRNASQMLKQAVSCRSKMRQGCVGVGVLYRWKFESRAQGCPNDVTLPSMYHDDSWCIQCFPIPRKTRNKLQKCRRQFRSHGLYSLGLTGPISMSISANLSVKFWHFHNLWHMLLPQ